jgi:hypothetical protein
MNAERAVCCFETKKEAIKYATKIVNMKLGKILKNWNIVFYIHRKDGTIERTIS